MDISSRPPHAASRLYHIATAVPRRTLVVLPGRYTYVISTATYMPDGINLWLEKDP
ncbi:MAG: hypothetical protein ABJA80_16895 [bacterium]